MKWNDKTVGYFSMEIGIQTSLPTYSGGLGVLAGDSLKGAADLGLPVIGVSLVYRKGYFKQSFDEDGCQVAEDVNWEISDQLKKIRKTVIVTIQGRPVKLRAWRFDIQGARGHQVPVYFLDADVRGNHREDRRLTDWLYGGDSAYRLAQEVILGQGGVALLQALGYSKKISTYHMNEGHAALLTLGLLEQRLGKRPLSSAKKADFQWVKDQCIFTTHTPVSAGHDRFDLDLAKKILQPQSLSTLKKAGALEKDSLNMTHLALTFSRYVNGVAMRHGQVSQKMFPHHQIDSITNGIHNYTWTSDSFRQLFDQAIPRWKEDNLELRQACELPLKKIKTAHREAKKALFQAIKQQHGISLKLNCFTIGFARRAATYKRADLLLSDLNRLSRIAKKHGGLQIVYAGKAHPKDEPGKALIQKVIQGAKKLAQKGITLIYLPNYDMDWGRWITAGVDLWLNNPIKPLEASGTSGMKASLNGVPNLSTLDGWWVEGHLENVTGWEIEDSAHGLTAGQKEKSRKQVAQSLYQKLDKIILPLYHKNPEGWAEVMRHSITLNGSFFNTHRMMAQYAQRAYEL